MNRFRLSLLGAAAALALHAAPGRTAEPDLKPPAWDWPVRAENLKVLPEKTPPEQLRAVMQGFTRALGVRCSHCHVGEEGKPLSTYDFPSDRNPKKEVARGMVKMVKKANEELREIRDDVPNARLAGVEVQCVMCHRGLAVPLTLSGTLTKAYSAAGADSAIIEYGRLRRRTFDSGAYDFREPSLDELGEYALAKNDTLGAIKIFELNMRQFPESGRVYERLGRAYLSLGDTARAMTSFQRALNVDPENRGAREGLRRLQRIR
jgi:tetratricopeptide (TPR) repeat protein